MSLGKGITTLSSSSPLGLLELPPLFLLEGGPYFLLGNDFFLSSLSMMNDKRDEDFKEKYGWKEKLFLKEKEMCREWEGRKWNEKKKKNGGLNRGEESNQRIKLINPRHWKL